MVVPYPHCCSQDWLFVGSRTNWPFPNPDAYREVRLRSLTTDYAHSVYPRGSSTRPWWLIRLPPILTGACGLSLRKRGQQQQNAGSRLVACRRGHFGSGLILTPMPKPPATPLFPAAPSSIVRASSSKRAPITCKLNRAEPRRPGRVPPGWPGDSRLDIGIERARGCGSIL
jgi:hypothetical protein